MEVKEKIIEELEGKRTEQIWDLIVKSIRKVSTEKITDKDLETAREEYLKHEDYINIKENEYLAFEHYNIKEGFFRKFYSYKNFTGRKTKKKLFIRIFEDYFEQDNGGEEIMIIDLEKKECYLVGKEVEYTHQKVEIK